MLLALAGCGGDDSKGDAQYRVEVVAQMNGFLASKVQEINQAARDMRDAAPSPVDRGWDATLDLDSVNTMKTAWVQMRSAWESSEGVLGALFGDLDEALDQRYEEFLAALSAGDADLFDGQGVTGMHAIERILYAHDTPSDVVAQEFVLDGYVPAAWPATPEQAQELKAGLLTELVDDTQRLVTGLTPGAIDVSKIFRGLIGLMNEQKDKVNLVGSHIDESRYSQRTLPDLRDNLAGTRAIYAFFVPWLNSKAHGMIRDGEVQAALNRLDRTYMRAGDKIPEPPPGWSSVAPTPADQGTPFGQLFVSVVQEVDPTYTGSAVDTMNRVAGMLGLPLFTGEP